MAAGPYLSRLLTHGICEMLSTVENNAGADLDLEQLRQRIAEADRELAILRRARDVGIQSAVQRGTTIREAARKAGVAPSYAHRCAHHGRFASVTRP